MAAAPRSCTAPGGSGGEMPISCGLCPSSAVTLPSCSCEEEADEVVEDEDAGGARDDRGVDRAPDAGSAALGGEAEVAARERDDEAEDEALHEAPRDVAE